MSSIFINEWTERRSLIRAIFAPFIGVTVFMALLFYGLGERDYVDLVMKTVFGVGAVSLMNIVLQVFRSYLKGPTAPVLQGILFMAAIWAGLFDLVSASFPSFGPTFFGNTGATIPIVPIMPIFVAVAVLTFVAKETRGLQQKLTETNTYLSKELKKREEEIAHAYEEREEQQKMAMVLRERQRIMEDVHDGFGGRLLALLLQAEKRTLDPNDLTDGLRDSLQDLRLIIDSLDTADGDIGLALGALRGRIEPQVKAATMSLKWRMEIPANLETDLTPRRILSIYRIIQEAVTNAVRHSGGSVVSVFVGAEQEGNVTIKVADNGKGLPNREDGAPPSGRGIRNIQSRAKSLIGKVDFHSSSKGVEITVVIPTRYDFPVMD